MKPYAALMLLVLVSCSAVYNKQPVAKPDQVATNVFAAISGNVGMNDELGNGSLLEHNFKVAAAGKGRLVFAAGGAFTYTPAIGSSAGTDTVSYTITDQDGDTSTSTLTVTLEPNTSPVAKTDTFETPDAATVATGNLSTNDTLGNGTLAQHSFAFVTTPTKGSLTLGVGGAFVYTPLAGSTGTDTVEYTITDRDGDSSKGKLYVHIGDVAPVAKTNLITTVTDYPISGDFTAEDILGNGTLAEHTFAVEQQPSAGGTVVITKDGKFTYSPPPASSGVGKDDFKYRITDKDGDTAVGTVNVIINGLCDGCSG